VDLSPSEVGAPDPGPVADSSVDPGVADDPPDVAPDPGAEDVLTADPGTPDEAGPPPGVAPDQPGPWSVATTSGTVTRGSRSTPVVAHVPQRDDGQPSPLVAFLPGFQAKAEWYNGTIQRLASHGFVVVAADPPAGLFSVSHTEMAADLSAVLDWALAPDGPLAGKVDPAHVGASGHSLGGKVATMAAFADARITALMALDPVNAGNPFTGYSDALPDIMPDQVAALTIPVGFVGETPSAEAQSSFAPACAPTDQNFQTFFAASTLSPWRAAWDLLGAGHMDFVDPNSGCGMACTLCVRGDADADEVLAATRTLMVAFYRRHFGGETILDAWLTGAKLPAGIDVTHAP
jgi:hypothetical protein